MSTHSEIALLLDDGSVISTYCHFDGYIKGVGLELIKNYNDPKNIIELIEGGALRTILGAVERLDDEDYSIWSNLETFKKEITKTGIVEYVYVFKDDKWFVLQQNDHGFFPLDQHSDVQFAMMTGKV